MPLTYTKIDIKKKGLFTVQEISPPMNGRILDINCSGGYISNAIYTCIDDNWRGPYKKPEYVESAIELDNILSWRLHNAYVYVIDMNEMSLEDIHIRLSPRFINISGQTIPVLLEGRMEVSIRVRNCNALLDDYNLTKFKSAENRVKNILKELFKAELEPIIDMIISRLANNTYQDGLLEIMALQVQEMIIRTINEDNNYADTDEMNNKNNTTYQWFGIDHCVCDLNITNWSQILEAINYEWEKGEKRDDKTFETDEEIRKKIAIAKIAVYENVAIALTNNYTRHNITDEMAGILREYAANNFDLPPENMVKIAENLVKLDSTTDIETYLLAMREMRHSLMEHRSKHS